MFISSWHGDHLFTSPLAEIAWCCSDLDKRSNFLALCSLAKVIIPIATEDFFHWRMSRILDGGSWSGQRVTGGCRHSPLQVSWLIFVFGQLKADVSCGALSQDFLLLPRALLFYQQPCCFSFRKQIQIWFIQSSQIYEENGWKTTEHPSFPLSSSITNIGSQVTWIQTELQNAHEARSWKRQNFFFLLSLSLRISRTKW